MCGPIAFAVGDRSKNLWFYQLGRGISYVGLGLIVALISQNFFSILFISQYLNIYKILIGLILSTTGLFLILNFKANFKLTKIELYIHKLYQLLPKLPTARAFWVGFLSIFLPCGWLWGNLLAAHLSDSVLHAGIYMLVFWIATLPALGFQGWLASRNIKYTDKLRGIGLIFAGIAMNISPQAIINFSPEKKISSNCDLQQEVCQIESMFVEILERPIQAGWPFTLKISGVTKQPNILIEGDSMSMGLIRVKFKEVNENNKLIFNSNVVLPICTSEFMKWRMTIDFESKTSVLYFFTGQKKGDQ